MEKMLRLRNKNSGGAGNGENVENVKGAIGEIEW
jgi:hypothetical protein